MDLRPRWSLHYQTTLLAVFITVVAVILVGWLTDRRGRATLLHHEMVDLGDDTNLRVTEIQSEVLQLGRTMRDASNLLATDLTDARQPPGLGPGVGPGLAPWLAPKAGEPAFKAAWEARVVPLAAPRNPNTDPPGKRFDGRAIDRLVLYDSFGPRGVAVGGSRVENGKLLPFEPVEPG